MTIYAADVGEVEDLCKRKQTRKQIFLAKMEQMVAWSALPNLTSRS